MTGEKKIGSLTPTECMAALKNRIKKEWRLAFFAAVVTGLLVHLPMMLSDIPNHDGLASMYFDQNMITSGRWFLTVACGLSSYFTLPWIISIFSLLLLGLTAAALTELLELHDAVTIVLVSGLLVVFPSITSTFAYVFTMDGYMLALLLSVLSVLCTKKWKLGFLAGGVCLAFSLGTYQAYLSFAVLLCIYEILMLCMKKERFSKKLLGALRYLAMGVIGAVLYLVILHVLLALQGKVLDTYQGISGLEGGAANGGLTGILSTIKAMYGDFAAFTFKGNVLLHNGFSAGASVALFVLTAAAAAVLAVKRGWWKSVWLYLLLLLAAAALPVACNLILLVSPGVTYHLLMRYQWVLFFILPLAFVSRTAQEGQIETDKASNSRAALTSGSQGSFRLLLSWGSLLAGAVLLLDFAVADNIAYSNLQKRYEKTYAYSLRLLDRIEQTPGYYQGIPIAMIGVVGDESFPVTDITQAVTSNMIGMSGDVLLYKSENYEAFIRHYLGATLNMLPSGNEKMTQIYYSEEYQAMDSFPGRDSIRIIDGILCIKTENSSREEGN